MFLLKYIAWGETIITKIDLKNFGNFKRFCLQNNFNKFSPFEVWVVFRYVYHKSTVYACNHIIGIQNLVHNHLSTEMPVNKKRFIFATLIKIYCSTVFI